MSGTPPRDGGERFGRSPRTARAAPARDDDALFRDELEKVWARLRAVASSDPEDFCDGSVSYDQACVAVLRVAAMLEAGSIFSVRFTAMSERARSAVVTTRNILGHAGYGTLRPQQFWNTVTVDLPNELIRIGLGRPARGD